MLDTVQQVLLGEGVADGVRAISSVPKPIGDCDNAYSTGVKLNLDRVRAAADGKVEVPDGQQGS